MNMEGDPSDPYGEKFLELMREGLGNEKKEDLVAPVIVPRSDWNALPPKETKPLVAPIQVTVFTHTATEGCYSREECIPWLQNKQKEDMEEREMTDIQFNFYIGGDGTIYEGRGWEVEGAKEDHNTDIEGLSVDIAYIGDYEDKDMPDDLIQIGCNIALYGRQVGLVHPNFNITTYWEDHVEIMRPKYGGYKQNPLDYPEKYPELHVTPDLNSH